MFPWTFSIIDFLSERWHAARPSPEGAIAARGFEVVDDTRSSDKRILAPTDWKNVGQLTYGRVSQTVDAARSPQASGKPSYNTANDLVECLGWECLDAKFYSGLSKDLDISRCSTWSFLRFSGVS